LPDHHRHIIAEVNLAEEKKGKVIWGGGRKGNIPLKKHKGTTRKSKGERIIRRAQFGGYHPRRKKKRDFQKRPLSPTTTNATTPPITHPLPESNGKRGHIDSAIVAKKT